jgi:hypothetical protein
MALSHTFQRWGIAAPPWGTGASGLDLESPGDEALRAWNQVDLVTSEERAPADVPISALLRVMWDTLDIFGTVSLSGVDVIVPVECVSTRTWKRVAGSVVRDDDRRTGRQSLALLEVGRAWPDAPADSWDTQEILRNLSTLCHARAVTSPELSFHPPSPIEHPFIPSDPLPLRAEVVLPDWTIDDAAWLAEAISISCSKAEVTHDVLIALRRQLHEGDECP